MTDEEKRAVALAREVVAESSDAAERIHAEILAAERRAYRKMARWALREAKDYADGTQPGPMLRYGVAREANRLAREVK